MELQQHTYYFLDIIYEFWSCTLKQNCASAELKLEMLQVFVTAIMLSSHHKNKLWGWVW